MDISQNDMERIQDKLEQGLITAAQANVELVRIQRVKLVTAKIPAQVRQSLNAAVKAGELKHIKKDGYRPECYFHPSFEYMVAGMRNNHARQTIIAIGKVCAPSAELI